jgi:hypothetical protein
MCATCSAKGLHCINAPKGQRPQPSQWCHLARPVGRHLQHGGAVKERVWPSPIALGLPPQVGSCGAEALALGHLDARSVKCERLVALDARQRRGGTGRLERRHTFVLIGDEACHCDHSRERAITSCSRSRAAEQQRGRRSRRRGRRRCWWGRTCADAEKRDRVAYRLEGR